MTAIYSINDGLEKLVGTSREGDFVHASQKMADAAGFRCVNKSWLARTMTYEQGLEQLEQGRAETEDMIAPASELRPTIDPDRGFALQRLDGRSFKPTHFCLGQLARWAGTGRFILDVLNKGDYLDANVMCDLVANGLRKLGDKPMLWRTRRDGTLRAILSDQYAEVDNRWFVEALAKIVPGGRLSHWRGDADTIHGNVLIPDSIREEDDGDYGGMLSVGNSEIGERKLRSLPSVFRAICYNGCVWGQKHGKGIKLVHRGKVNLDQLFDVIRDNLQAQIPLLPQGIDLLLATKAMGWDGASMKPVIAQACKDHKIGKAQASMVLGAYVEETKATGEELGRSLFGLVNAFTRAGQKLAPGDWARFDEIGGELVQEGEKGWGRTIARAARLAVKEVEEAFAVN